jgi:zinc protease
VRGSAVKIDRGSQLLELPFESRRPPAIIAGILCITLPALGVSFMRASLLLSACLTLVAAQVRAESKPLFDYRESTLDNGLHVITLEDHSCPIVAVELWYHVGSKDEQPDRQGFAHMFEHMMFRGTDHLGPKDHFEYIRRCGGTCNAYTHFDRTVYHEILPANQLELALWLEAERMGFLRIDQTAFDTERKVVEEERRLGLNRPYGTVIEKVLPELFKVHPYGWSPIGRIPHLRAASTQELRDFWMRYYVPNNATLVIVGDIKHEEAQRLARQSFGWIPREADPPRVTTKEPQPTQARAVTLKEDNAPAPAVGIGWRIVPSRNEDYVALEMLGSILGGGKSSRLYRDLVVENHLAVMAMAATFSLEQEGFLGAAAILVPLVGDTAKVREALQKHVAKLRTERVSDHELTKARNQMLAALVTGNLTVESKASLLGDAAVMEGDVSRVNHRIEQIRRVTADDLLRVAKTYLAPEHSLTVTIEQRSFSLFGGRSRPAKSEEDAPITAKPETTPPPPGRPGLRRPAEFPAKPPVAKLPDARFTIPHTRHVLANGLRVLVVPNHEVPYLTIELGLQAGAWTEPKPGVASMTLGMLTKGTAKHNEKQLADELETYAINLSGSGQMDSSSVSAGCLTEHVERALTLLAEVVQQPTFPKDEFERLRKQERTQLAISAAEPAYQASRELRRRLYGQHPYARTRTGEPKDLDALQVADLAPWWHTFARPDQAVLIFAGDIDDAKALQLAEKTLGSWKAEGPAQKVDLPAFPKSEPRRIYLVDYPRGVQSQIRVGQLAIKRDDPGYPIAEVVGDYFGGAFSSRLNDTIRVKKGLTYGARGGYQSANFAGEFTISTFSKTESTAEAVRVVFDEIERLQHEPPTAKELETTKSYSVGSFARDRETPQQVAGDLWLIESQGLPADYFERTLAKIIQTDAAACNRLIRETLDPAHMVVVVVGNAGKVRADLEKIAPVTLVTPDARSATTPAPAKKKVG